MLAVCNEKLVNQDRITGVAPWDGKSTDVAAALHPFENVSGCPIGDSEFA